MTTSEIVLGMNLEELSIRDLREEIHDIRNDINNLEAFLDGDMLATTPDFDAWFRRTYTLPKFSTLPLDVQARIRARYEYYQNPEYKAKMREYMREYNARAKYREAK